MCSRCRVDELSTDAHFVSRFAHTAFEHITHHQLEPELLHIDCAALVGEAGVPCDDEETAKARQRSDYFLDNTVCEVLLIAVATQVIEWEDSDRGFAG